MESQGHGPSAVSGPVNFTMSHGHVLQLQTQEAFCTCELPVVVGSRQGCGWASPLLERPLRALTAMVLIAVLYLLFNFLVSDD